MKPVRSLLFVPGNKPAWMEKAIKYGADILILDLEDSVPDSDKVAARPLVKEALKFLTAKGQTCNVRVNGFATGLTLDDLDGILCPEINGIALPKVERVDDMKALDTLLTHLEKKHGIETGTIKTGLGIESAKGLRNAYDIVTSCPRVTALSLACGPGGDAGRSMGYIWSKEGTETLYIRSKAVLDARAAGIQYPTVSSWWDIKDLEGLARDARFNRSLGFRGMTVMHPTHVPIVNEVFTPSAEEIRFYKGLIAALEEGEKKGTAAVVYQGDMVDYAMAKTAKEMLNFARSIGLKIDDD
ncbi:MAG: CoA ester lyase [Deltaproteobacteria bacterium]|nr:CoA ester lyase [Deltaproteobacteria bacterium]